MVVSPNSRRIAHATLACMIILFFLNGLAIIPHLGIQTDEAIFSGPLFPGGSGWFEISIFKKKVPFMVMTYLGTVKTGLYWLLLHIFAPSVYLLRVPPSSWAS